MSNFACTNCGKSISPAASYGTHDSGPMCLACYSEPSPPTFRPIEIRLRTPEEIAAQLPDWITRAIVAESDLKRARAEIATLTEQVEVLETLLASYKPIIDALPPCPKHGAGCVWQTQLWIDRAKAVMRETGDKPCAFPVESGRKCGAPATFRQDVNMYLCDEHNALSDWAAARLLADYRSKNGDGAEADDGA